MFVVSAAVEEGAGTFKDIMMKAQEEALRQDSIQKANEVHYLPEESQKLGRHMPLPWWAYILIFFMSQKTKLKYQKQSGYVLFTRA